MADYPDPPIIPDLPPAPIRNEPKEDYTRKASEFTGAMNPWGQAINVFGDWVSGLAAAVLGYLQSAEQARDDAEQHAQESRGYSQDSGQFAQAASDYASAAASNAHFAGEWGDLSGPLAIPASVYHTGTLWQLLHNIPDVAASEPDSENPDWAPAGASMAYPAAGVVVSTGTGWGDSLPAPASTLVGVSDEQELTAKTLGAATKESVTTAAAISITDASAPFQQITLTANATAAINLSVGVTRTVWINRATYTPTWPAGMKWVGGEEPTLPASKLSCITFTGIPGNTAGLAALFWSEE